MKLTRKSRSIAALLALVSLLFAQLAVAAYSCPGMQAGQFAAAAASLEDQPMPGCQNTDPEQPTLCKSHAQGGSQSLDKHEVPKIPPLMLAGAALDSCHVDVARRPSAAPSQVPLTRATAPPIQLRHCRFLI